MRWQRIWYRFTQFFHVLWANVRAVDQEYAAQHLLNPALLSLFQTMPRQEQNHAIDVCRALEAEGYTDHALLTAALLHDVGKNKLRISILERVWVVLGEFAFPKASQHWAAEEHSRHLLYRGFILRQHHAAWGADLALAAGANERVADIIRGHHEQDSENTLIRALYAADDR